MLTISKPLTAGQAKKYYEAEYSNARESYYTEDETIDGEWFGKLAKEWGLEGAVDKEAFARLTEGQDPHTGEQLVRHVTTKEYENQFGEKVKNSEHRAGYDATFSAPKSVSLAALVGDDARIREAHRTAVKTSMGELENYVQSRMGGNTPAQTTRNLAAALFEHDSARPDKDTGYAAPQLHTHAVIFNLTRLDNDQIKPVQPIELYRSQKYATAIYRAVLSEELQKLGYEIEVDPRTGAPEIKGFSEEYLVASSPRRRQIKQEAAEIKERFSQQGITVKEGAGLNQAAAKLDRKSKRYDRIEMRARHQEMDALFDNQATQTVDTARERETASLNEDEIKKRAQAAVTFARQNAGAREAVVDKRKVMVDALRRNLSFTTHGALVEELNQRVQSGEFIPIQRFDKFEELTTSQMLALERSNIHQMLAGRNTQQPMMKRKEASKVIKEIFEQKGKKSSFDQYKAVGQILVTRDRVFALEGLAGTGKTTALAILREAAERQGYAIRGLAPTGRAADKLAESGIKTTTLQAFLKEPQFGPVIENNRRLYVLDESSLSDTKNVHLFLKKAGPESRILLVGDPAQHQAVEAGAPFEQLIKAGIRTARLDKILRQRTNLKKPVQLLSQKEVFAAVAVLDSQGRITEIKDDIDRLQAIATDYVNNPKGTLIISPANSERVAINTLIHHELQTRESVSKQSHIVSILINRQDMTGPERTFALAYVPGEDIIRYNTTSKLYGVKPGDYGRVLANNHKDNTITVRFESGREMSYNPERLSGVSVYREAQREFAVGDRIQFRAPFAPGKVKNSELGTIQELTEDTMTVRLDKKRDVSIKLDQFRHLDHGYAVTSHSSQGQTVNRVIVNAETTETDALVNQRMAYVAISRARFEARVYTDSLKEVGSAFNREKNKEIALEALNESHQLSLVHVSSQIEPTLSQAVLTPKSHTFTNAVDNRPARSEPGLNNSPLNPQLNQLSQSNGSHPKIGPGQARPFGERMRELNQQLVLGEKFAATMKEKYAARYLEEVINAGSVRRYWTMDETTGLRRKMSVHDIEQRAMRVAGRLATEQLAAVDHREEKDAYKWRELRDVEYSQQIDRHSSTIQEIRDAHASEIQKLAKTLEGAGRESLRANTTALKIENAINASGAQLPIPVIPNEKLNELQMSAIRNRDADAFGYLERIRQYIPHELGGGDRDGFSVGRLRGQAIVAESNVRVAEKRFDDFERSRHFARFEIGGEQWSLVRVDREQRLAEQEIEFHKNAISAYRWRLYSGLQNPWKLRDIGEYRQRSALAKENIINAREQIRNLQPIRIEVQHLIEEHRAELKAEVHEERQLGATLNNAIRQETELRPTRAQDLPPPEFNRQELKRIEQNSMTLRDSQLLKTAQSAMELRSGHTPDGDETILSRALGRAEAVDISLQEITRRIQSFTENRDFFPVLFKGADGNEKTTTLHDCQPRTLTEKVFNYFSPADRFEIDVVIRALDQHHLDLSSEKDSLDQFASAARELAKSCEQSLQMPSQQAALNAQRRMPEFTAREIAQLENFAAQQSDSVVRAQVETMIRSTISSAQVSEFKSLTAEHWNQSQTQGNSLEQIQSSRDDHLGATKDVLDKVSANGVSDVSRLNEAGVAAEMDTALEILAALL
jgi:conjugative relaxase-like TrwC/TraI family protein